MVDLNIIMPETRVTECVSSLTYTQRPERNLHVCLDPPDLNKAFLCEYYKASTFDEISHKLISAKVLVVKTILEVIT